MSETSGVSEPQTADDSRVRVTDAVVQLKALFLEIPGTRLTAGEAARLSGVDLPVCEIILNALTDAGFLQQRAGGIFVRRGTNSTGS